VLLVVLSSDSWHVFPDQVCCDKRDMSVLAFIILSVLSRAVYYCTWCAVQYCTWCAAVLSVLKCDVMYCIVCRCCAATFSSWRLCRTLAGQQRLKQGRQDWLSLKGICICQQSSCRTDRMRHSGLPACLIWRNRMMCARPQVLLTAKHPAKADKAAQATQADGKTVQSLHCFIARCRLATVCCCCWARVIILQLAATPGTCMSVPAATTQS
jgi:hypothetical protein